MSSSIPSKRSRSSIHLSPVVRVFSRIENDTDTGCWNYTGQLDGGGYGVLNLRKGKSKWGIKVHRLMWEHYNGPIPKGMFILHQCDNRRCCNPAHLRPGTHQENMDEAKARGRLKVGVESSKCVLAEHEVYEIRGMYDAGIDAVTIAIKFGVSRSVIYQIGGRQTWKHLPESEEWATHDFRQVSLVSEIVDVADRIGSVPDLESEKMIVTGSTIFSAEMRNERPPEIVAALYRFA